MEVCEAVSPLVSGLLVIQNILGSILDSVFSEAIDGHIVPTTAGNIRVIETKYINDRYVLGH